MLMCELEKVVLGQIGRSDGQQLVMPHLKQLVVTKQKYHKYILFYSNSIRKKKKNTP